MQAKSLFAAVIASTFALGAFAQEATSDDINFVRNAASTKTRAEVQAEVIKARADGKVVHSGEVTHFNVDA